MKQKYISVLICFVMIISLFQGECFGCVSAEIERRYLPKEENGILALSLGELNERIEVKSVYTDDNGCIRAIAFKLDKGAAPDNFAVSIDGILHNITAAPEDNGMVYEYFDGGAAVGSEVTLQFFGGDEQTSPTAVSPVKIVEGNEGDWTASENGHTLYLYTGSDHNVVVPNFYNNTVVTTVGGHIEGEYYTNILRDDSDRVISSAALSEGIINVNHFAFCDISALTEVSLPQSLENIGQGAFAYSPITCIELPEGLKGLYPYSFFECGELTGDINIPSGVKSIGEAAFYNCPKMTGSIILNEGVEEIGDMAFAGAGVIQRFTSLSLPSTLRKIGCYAFQNCSYIQHLELPEGLETISDGAFDHMSGIDNTVLVIPSTVTVIGGDYNVEQNTGYGGHVFYDMGKNSSFAEFQVAEGNDNFKAVDGVLYSADMTRMLAYPRGKSGDVFEIPEGITQLDEMAFSRAANLKTVVLPNSYEIKTALPENILNQDGNTLAVALYVYTTVSNVQVKAENPRYTSVDGILYSKDMKTLWYIPTQYKGAVSLSDKCENMEKGCVFTGNKASTGWDGVKIPASVFRIDPCVIEFLNKYFKDCINVSDSIYYTVDSEGKIKELSYTAGDADMNGAADNADAAAVLRLISDISDNRTINKKAADMNGDGTLDITDAIAMLAAVQQA